MALTKKEINDAKAIISKMSPEQLCKSMDILEIRGRMLKLEKRKKVYENYNSLLVGLWVATFIILGQFIFSLTKLFFNWSVFADIIGYFVVIVFLVISLIIVKYKTDYHIFSD